MSESHLVAVGQHIGPASARGGPARAGKAGRVAMPLLCQES